MSNCDHGPFDRRREVPRNGELAGKPSPVTKVINDEAEKENRALVLLPIGNLRLIHVLCVYLCI